MVGQRFRSLDPQVGLLLAGETGALQSLGGGARADRHRRRRRAGLLGQDGIGLPELLCHRVRQGGALDLRAKLAADLLHRCRVLGVEPAERGMDSRPQPGVLDERVVGEGGEGKPRRYPQPSSHHLAQARVLAPNQRPGLGDEVPEPDDVRCLGCHCFALSAPQSRNVTTPVLPSTRSRCPVLIFVVAQPVPTTAGSPYSRDTMAAWDIIPPMSETAARILLKTGVQLGEVIVQTKISPSWIELMSSTLSTTLAGPSATPPEPAKPESVLESCPPAGFSHSSTRSVVMPQSMTVKGSVMTSGGGPSAGGGVQL